MTNHPNRSAGMNGAPPQNRSQRRAAAATKPADDHRPVRRLLTTASVELSARALADQVVDDAANLGRQVTLPEFKAVAVEACQMFGKAFTAGISEALGRRGFKVQ